MGLATTGDLYLVTAILLIATATLFGMLLAASGVWSNPAFRRTAYVVGLWLFLLAIVLLTVGAILISSPALVLFAFVGLLVFSALVLAEIGLFRFPWLARWTTTFAPGLRVTGQGQAWFVLTAVFLTVGAWRGLNLVLFLAYFMLLAWMLNFFLAGRRLHHVKGKRRIDGPIFAQAPFLHGVEVHNDGARPLIGVRIVDRGPEVLSWFAVRLAGGERRCFRQEVVRPQPGCYARDPLQAVSGYPFGLVERSIVIGAGEDLIVLPCLGRLHRGRLRTFLGASAAGPGWRGHFARPQPLVPTELHGIRPYRRGDSPRWIHWRTSARRGELMVREYEEASDDNLVLVFDPSVPDAVSGANSEQLFQDALSLAATVCWEWCRQKDDRFTLVVGGLAPAILDGITSREHALHMLETLAVTLASTERSSAALQDCLARTTLPSGPVLVVGAAPAALGAQLTAWLQRPVRPLSAGELDRQDFYERPDPHAA